MMTTAMQRIGQHFERWVWVERGQTMAEYGLIMAAVFLVAAGAYRLFGGDIGTPVEATSALFTSGS